MLSVSEVNICFATERKEKGQEKPQVFKETFHLKIYLRHSKLAQYLLSY